MTYRFLGLFFGLGLVLWRLAPADDARKVSIDFDAPREMKLDPAAPADSKAMQIATWNIDHGAHLDTISSELKKKPSDLLLLQEVDWNAKRSDNVDVATELASRLKLNLSFGIEFEELSQEDGHPAYIGQATLSRYPIRRSRVLRFKRQSNFWQPKGWIPSKMPLMQRRLGNRIALVTDLDLNGKLLVVYNAHLESRSMGFIQAKQLDEMLTDLQAYPAGTEAIIGGDLNSKYFPATVLHKLEKDGFQSALGNRIKRTHTIMMALDWIFVRGPFEWSDGAVRRDVKGSDHYPIYATLHLK